ncbi:MAG TPA: DUF4202 domain-containing protein [Saprospiraceae bacterium]|nr:DUF4202 domain-containing protein [Saprospiraceae bacterium]HPN71171.1 DUF4202 domain-containing protein [Saprospiraceae bacterium]
MAETNDILKKIDEYNALDPNMEDLDDGSQPSELVYGRRMSEMVDLLEESPSKALIIAARAQHIQRWKIQRSTYENNREGYLRWRNELKKFHAATIAQILEDFGESEELKDRVVFLVQKKDFKRDQESQTIEDAACLVFLKYYFSKFALKTNHDKMVEILQKSWGKMSEKAHMIALAFTYGKEEADLINKALNGG